METKFQAQLKETRSYATRVGDKTYTIVLAGEDSSMAECIEVPGDCLVEVTIKMLPKE